MFVTDTACRLEYNRIDDPAESISAAFEMIVETRHDCELCCVQGKLLGGCTNGAKEMFQVFSLLMDHGGSLGALWLPLKTNRNGVTCWLKS